MELVPCLAFTPLYRLEEGLTQLNFLGEYKKFCKKSYPIVRRYWWRSSEKIKVNIQLFQGWVITLV